MAQSKTMKQVVEVILLSHGILDQFQKSESFAVQIENKGFLPLCIERHGSTVSIAHYFVQNGDSIADPDMEFEVRGDQWTPIAIQFAIGVYRRAVIYKDGVRLVSMRELRDQRAFAKMWAENLEWQGYAKGQLVQAKAC